MRTIRAPTAIVKTRLMVCTFLIIIYYIFTVLSYFQFCNFIILGFTYYIIIYCLQDRLQEVRVRERE